jgi:hypothetical protein
MFRCANRRTCGGRNPLVHLDITSLITLSLARPLLIASSLACFMTSPPPLANRAKRLRRFSTGSGPNFFLPFMGWSCTAVSISTFHFSAVGCSSSSTELDASFLSRRFALDELASDGLRCINYNGFRYLVVSRTSASRSLINVHPVCRYGITLVTRPAFGAYSGSLPFPLSEAILFAGCDLLKPGPGAFKS